MLRSRWYTWYAIIPGTVARPERLPAGFARSSLAHRSGPPARLRARRPTRLADSLGCRTPGRLRRPREFDRLTAVKRSADWSQIVPFLIDG